MVPVSNEWKAVQNDTLLPEMFVEIIYNITEPGLQDSAIPSANYPESFSDVEQVLSLVDKHSEAYTALDYGCWGLDGSFYYFNGSPQDPGYVDRNFSTANGSLDVSPYPTITIDFPSKHDLLIPGVTITWNGVFGGWATDFRLTAYNASGMVAQTTVVGNTSITPTVFLDMEGYSKITLEILKWSHPYQRVRCMEIMLGVQKKYEKADLLGYDHNQTVDLLSAALPENTITFKLRNDDDRWNPDSPTGSEKYLMEQQEVRVRYGMDINGTTEWIDGGTFWLSEWSTPANGMEAVFTARDAVGFMAANYSGVRSGTLYDIAVAAFTEANIPAQGDGTGRYVVHEGLKDIITDFSSEESDYTISDVLQMVAHAGCCVFYQDRSGVMHIEPWSKQYSNYMIEPRISYKHPEYTISKPLKAVSVGYGDKQREVIEVSSRGETQTIDNALILTKEIATAVGVTARDVLENRKTISGEFRADLRLDALDSIIVTSKYASNVIAITSIKYSTSGGTFRGTYTGRVVSISLEPIRIYSGEIYAGEVW